MNNKILQLEHDISSFISKDNDATVHFEYSKDSFASETASAYTVNPETKEVFLLKTVRTNSKELALEEILEYVIKSKYESNYKLMEILKLTGSAKLVYYKLGEDYIEKMDKILEDVRG